VLDGLLCGGTVNKGHAKKPAVTYDKIPPMGDVFGRVPWSETVLQGRGFFRTSDGPGFEMDEVGYIIAIAPSQLTKNQDFQESIIAA